MSDAPRRPTAGERLLGRLLREELRDPVLGDLAEERAARAERDGERAAQRWLRRQVTRSLGAALLHRFTVRPRRRRDMAGFLEARLQDVRFGARTLRRSPAFAVSALVVLALGIGVATAVFTVVEDVLLRPLPYPGADRLWYVSQDGDDGSYWLSAPNFRDMTEQLGSFADLAAFTTAGSNLLVGGRPEHIATAEVDAAFFRTLGVTPALGRTFSEAEREAGAPVVVISHGLWLRLLGGRSDVVGARLLLDGEAREVLGVLPPGPMVPARAEAWTPLSFSQPEWRTQRGLAWLQAIGRARPGVDLPAMRAEARALAGRLRATYPAENAQLEIGFQSLTEATVGRVERQLWVLLAAAVLVLLAGAVNVGGLLLGRVAARRQEVAVRRALGGSRGRLAAQLLSEGALLAGLAGLAGTALAAALVRWLVAAAPPGTPRLGEVAVGPATLLVAIGTSAATVLVFGCLPAFASLQGLAATLRARHGAGGGRARAALVVVQTALALTLLAGAGLLAKSVWRLQQVDPGYEADRVLVAGLPVPGSAFATPGERHEHYRRIRERVAALPGVEGAALTSSLPFTGNATVFTFDLPARPFAPAKRPPARYLVVGPDFFATMGIPLLRGRTFTAREALGTGAPPIVVSADLVRKHLAGIEPIGARIAFGDGEPFTVVGVVPAVREGALDREPPFAQVYVPVTPDGGWDLSLVVRSAADPAALAEPLRRAVQEVAPAQPVSPLQPLAEVAMATVAGRAFSLHLLAAFSIATLLLAAVGLHGLLAMAVAARQREIGVRIALGATTRRIRAAVAGHACRLAALGLAAGLATTLALSHLMGGLLYEVQPRDPAVLLAVSALLAVVVALASWQPARRATRVPPHEALRAD